MVIKWRSSEVFARNVKARQRGCSRKESPRWVVGIASEKAGVISQIEAARKGARGDEALRDVRQACAETQRTKVMGKLKTQPDDVGEDALTPNDVVGTESEK